MINFGLKDYKTDDDDENDGPMSFTCIAYALYDSLWTKRLKTNNVDKNVDTKTQNRP